MRQFKNLSTRATVFTRPNVDTDVIIPARHLKTLTRDGLGAYAFESERYDADGRVRNDSPFEEAARGVERVLIAGENFGCGSSREHAVWALMALGYDAVIAPSFADIFTDNAARNGLLLITPSAEDHEALARTARDGASVSIDLDAQTVSAGGRIVRFEIDPERKRRFLEGLDDIAFAEAEEDAIAAFEASDRAARPWLWNTAR